MKKQKTSRELNPRFTIEEIAAAYSVHIETVRKWIVRHGCPAISTGGSWRLDPGEVEAWLRARGHQRSFRRSVGAK
jgi:excisionase family DNA binding protein